MAKKANSEIVSAKNPDSEQIKPRTGAEGSQYTVVARRYRPRSFGELVGQQTVAEALKSAIESDRVGHAYLFTGARGVGKTSTARIFAKALNLSKANAEELAQDLELAIDSGEDMDVIEIDGASNRGIEEIRQLRANATVRPSRAAYKIYIIDEVHMLTLPAFNALLKTLEEPPEHVKFIFCTTDPEKIPITVLSRCQRFDFSPIKTDQIKKRLAEICSAESVIVQDDALSLIARRANGSMRDSQSLLEQLLSFSGDSIGIDSVHAMLGTADDTRLAELMGRLIDRDAGNALQLIEDASQAGVDAGQMAEQLLGYLRDIMAVGIGASAELMKTANPADLVQLKEMAARWGTMTLLAAIQMLDETLVRMRHSVQSRILLEVCLVQICHLQDLQAIANLAQAIRENTPLPPVIPARSKSVSTNATARPASNPSSTSGPTVAEKKNDEVDDRLAIEADGPGEDRALTAVLEAAGALPNDSSPIIQMPIAVEEETALASDSIDDSLPDSQSPTTNHDMSPLEMWRQAAVGCEGMLSDCANMAISIDTVSDSNAWEVNLPAGSQFAMQILMEAKNIEALRQNLSHRFGIRKVIRFKTESIDAARADSAARVALPVRSLNQGQLIRSLSNHSLIAQIIKSLNAEVTKVDVPANYTLEETNRSNL
jgi:DNA polymerase-3 subunit gamma/tau